MNAKLRNWLLGAVVIAVFILGVPLVQLVFAGADKPVQGHEGSSHVSPAAHEQGTQPDSAHAAHASHAAQSQGTHPQVTRIGDKYLRIVPMGEESICAQLYDSNFKLLATNENKTVLTFALPNGEKQSLNIAVPGSSECSAPQGSSGKDSCCPPEAAAMHKDCAHDTAGAPDAPAHN
jgi:hypothetical protein